MNKVIQNIINFYRDCYQFEYSTEKVLNFYSSTVSNLYYPKSFKILSHEEYELPVDSKWGKKVIADLKLESSEKKLVCGSFFLKGRIEMLGKSHRIFTPLFLNDITLKCVNEIYSLIVTPGSTSLNPIAINYLNSLEKNIAHKYDDLSTEFLNQKNIFSFFGLVQLNDLLKEKYPNLNSELIDQRIESDNRISKLDTIYNSRKSSYENILFPDILIGLVDKPKKSKDVINELTELGKRAHNNFSILSNIFLNSNIEAKLKVINPKKQEIVVPVSLSQSQEKILISSNQSRISIVIGPPGTGKSFSIAALAIQAFQEGKKVLIASKNEQACQVLYNKIQNDIGIKGITVNASKTRYRIGVSTKLMNISNGIGVKPIDKDYLIKVRDEVNLLKKEIKDIINEITSRESIEKKWVERLSTNNKNMFSSIQKKWIKYRHSLKEPIWDLKHQLHKYNIRLKTKEKLLIKLTYQNNIYRLLSKNRHEVLKYQNAFVQTRGNVIKEIFSSIDFNIVLEALPIWICRSIDVANIVPLKEGLFDLLIIDEASQCDISSSLPLIYRAKSMTIVGDPNQLRHISFISKRKEELTRKKYNLDTLKLSYRDKSILDQVNGSIKSQKNIIFLDEHFRSMPDIINFSNNHFYSGKLKIMTEHLNERDYDNLNIKYIENGKRNQKGENYAEANYIINSVKKIINKEIKLSSYNCSTIGIISPFRYQVQLIKRLVKEEIELNDIHKHKILIGTPFKFQGEERDIVFLSFTIDKETHPASIRFLERPDVFNVSITRAKTIQNVCISITPNILDQESLLSKYLLSKPQKQIEIIEKPIYDQFLEEVKFALDKLNSGRVLVNRKICGTKIDIVVVQENRSIGIDLIGFPGEYANQLTMNEIMSLERAKISVFLLPYSTWRLNKDLCLKSLNKFVKT